MGYDLDQMLEEIWEISQQDILKIVPDVFVLTKRLDIEVHKDPQLTFNFFKGVFLFSDLLKHIRMLFDTLKEREELLLENLFIVSEQDAFEMISTAIKEMF